ncbi:MAG: ABC transporter substrate-binding protein [Planctomycetes bacterium]|nr:ABC transporter substrate-binding protein [Planctomycetota bacterium]
MRCPTILAVTALASLLVAGCLVQRPPTDELLIASPHRDEIKEEIERAFRAWYTKQMGRDVRVIWLDLGGTSNIQRYIADRLTSGHSAGIDVLFGGGSDPFEALKRQGHLVAYKLPDEILSKLPTDLHGVPLYDSDHHWYGAVLSTFGIMYNREVLRRVRLPEPVTWEDLGSAAYVRDGIGWVGAADPRHSGSVHMIYENILQAYGWEQGFSVLARMAANARGFTRESASVPRQVQLGEVACAPVIEFYAFSLMAREGRDRIGFVLPEGLTVIGPDGVAIVRGAPNQLVAEAFLRFLLCEEGQRIWMLRHGAPGGPLHYDLGRLSVLPHLYEANPEQSAVTLNPFQAAVPLRYDGRVASMRWNVLNDLLGAVLIDSHSELQQAWVAVQQAPNQSDLIAELTHPPCEENELVRLAEPVRQSPRLRNVTIAEWMAAARQRYRSVAETARRQGVTEPAATE